MIGPGPADPADPVDEHHVDARTFDRLLAQRRMCRDFTEQPVADAELDRVLAAALRAPSAGNATALDLVVLVGAQVDDYWATTMAPDRRAGFAWPGLLSAPVLVLPYVDPGAYVARYGESDKVRSGLGAGEDAWSVPYWWVDGGAAVMAMLLAADSAGLGALFFGQFEHEAALARRFGVPSSHRALGTIALGHPGPDAARRSASARRGRPSVAEVVHRGGWTDR
ncbi:MAG: nitroreductase family protein [Microthrixaceae bacterium]